MAYNKLYFKRESNIYLVLSPGVALSTFSSIGQEGALSLVGGTVELYVCGTECYAWVELYNMVLSSWQRRLTNPTALATTNEMHVHAYNYKELMYQLNNDYCCTLLFLTVHTQLTGNIKSTPTVQYM